MLAGLVLLGTVLASVVVARGRFLSQRAAADRQLLVTAAVDQLVSDWTLSGIDFDRVPRSGSGPLPGIDGCHWRTIERRAPEATALDSRIVRIEVWSNESERGSRGLVTALDLLVPNPAAAAPSEGSGETR